MRMGDTIIGVVAGALGDYVEVQVILHVRADARQIVHDVDSCGPQGIGGTNTGELQQAR